MKKIKKEVSFTYTLKHNVVSNLKIVTEQIGDLTCECVGTFNPTTSPLNIYERYSVDIDFIKWNGQDIKPVLQLTDMIADIEEAALKAFAKVVEPTPKLNLGRAFDVLKNKIA